MSDNPFDAARAEGAKDAREGFPADPGRWDCSPDLERAYRDGYDAATSRSTLPAVSPAAFSVLCGLVHPSDDVDTSGIFAPPEVWAELRAALPLDHFRETVPAFVGDELAEADELPPLRYEV